MMFAKGTRFAPFKAPEVPGPNAYDIHDAEYDAYKHGAFLENADRFGREKSSDIPGPGRITPDPTKDVKVAKPSKPAAKSTSADRYAILQRKVEDLERIHLEGKKSHQAEVGGLKQELARSQKTNSEQTERHDKLRKQIDSLETRVQELKKVNDGSQAEAKDLRIKLRVAEHERIQLASKQGEIGEAKKALQALDSKRRDDLREWDRKIAELEKAHTTEKKRREALETRIAEVEGKVDAETHQAKAVASGLESQLQEAKTDASRATSCLNAFQKQAEDAERELLDQLEQHRQLLSRVAQEYGRLASSTVPKTQHDRLKLDFASSQLRMYRMDRKLANTEGQVQDLAQLIRQNKEENHLLLEHLRGAESIIMKYSAALRHILRERERDVTLDHDLYADLASLRTEESKAALAKERAIASDASAWSDLYRVRNEHLLWHSTALLKHMDDRDAQLQQQSKQLSAADAKYSDLQCTLTTLRSGHDDLQRQLAASIANLAEANGRTEVLKKEFQDTEVRLKGDITRIEQSLSQEKEANRRLAGTVQKGKMAEEALQADIEQLTARLGEVEQYQEAYVNLVDEVGALIQRNALAEEETQRLSKFNAEILGHNNPAQRIMYIDRIRRELHETKQELLMIQRDREAAAYENDDLRRELQLYKSVAVPSNHKPRTHVTRVERAPLGDQNVNVKSANAASDGTDSGGNYVE